MTQRFQKSKLQSKPGSLYIEGAAALAEYLKLAPADILKIQARTDAKLPRYLLHNCAQQGFKIELCRTAPHPSLTSPVWAAVRVREYREEDLVKSVEQQAPKLIVVGIDHVTDPRNLGAIVRSAAFFGVPWVIVPTKRQAQISQTVVATAQGGFAVVKVASVVNLRRTLQRLKELQYWLLGAHMQGEPCDTLKNFYEKQVLVLGSEDKGIGEQTRKLCDRMVAIPGGDSGFDSLNVSVAAGILIHLLS